MRDKQRSAALAPRSSGSQLPGKGIAFNFILRTTRRNWRHSGSIDASVPTLYGQIRHTAWRVSDWPVIDAAYWLAVFPRRGWRTELCRTPFDSGLPMDAKVPQRHVAFGRADKQPVRCFIVSPQGALHALQPACSALSAHGDAASGRQARLGVQIKINRSKTDVQRATLRNTSMKRSTSCSSL
jgi:hypothetical protein